MTYLNYSKCFAYNLLFYHFKILFLSFLLSIFQWRYHLVTLLHPNSFVFKTIHLINKLIFFILGTLRWVFWRKAYPKYTNFLLLPVEFPARFFIGSELLSQWSNLLISYLCAFSNKIICTGSGAHFFVFFFCLRTRGFNCNGNMYCHNINSLILYFFEGLFC